MTFGEVTKVRRKEGGTWAGGGKWKKIGDRVQPLSDTWSARAEKGRQILNSEEAAEKVFCLKFIPHFMSKIQGF